MKATIQIEGKEYQTDLSKPLDISIPLEMREDAVNCFYAPLFEYSPVRAGDFVGSTKEGGLLNFMNIRLNPHGNGTHTECVGHIAKETYTINQSLQQFFFLAQLITVYPTMQENGDRVIELDQIKGSIRDNNGLKAIIIRTMPNHLDKLNRNYSGGNPPYLHHEATSYLVDQGIEHLLIDLPSVDREEDGGTLLSHKAFWKYPHQIRQNATITELIFVPSVIKDDLYLLNIQIGSFELDVSPSKPILFELLK